MDAAGNPYNYTAGARPPELAGRNAITERAQNTIRRTKSGKAPKSLILTGLRGVGKTVLLGEFEKIAEQEGCLARIMHDVGRFCTPDGGRVSSGRLAWAV
jgi:hypothetical protein